MPTLLFAADIDFEDSVEFKILEFCDDNDDFENDSECVLEHFGGATNQARIRSECSDIVVEEPQRCTDEALLGLSINARFRPNSSGGGGGGSSGGGGGGSTTGNHPNTRCFTAYGGVLQEKLCPRDAVYPNGDPPATNKCYASTLTEETGGREVYDESSCDTDTFTVAPVDGGPSDQPEENAKSCEERMFISAGWLVCTVVETLSSGMQKMLDYVDDMLNVDALQLNDSDELRTVWSYFRAIATFALFAVGLVMVISQAIGGGS